MRLAALTMIILGCAACAGTSDGSGAEEASKKKKDAGVVGCGSSPDMGAAPSDLAFNPRHDLSTAPPADLALGNGGACGGTFCRGDQICVAGQCTYACDGYNVPGDYATIQSAVNALQSIGGTICVGPGTFNENVGAGKLAAPLTIIGAGAGATSLPSISATTQTKGTLTVKALTATSYLEVHTVTANNLFEGVVIGNEAHLDQTGASGGSTTAGLTVRYSRFNQAHVRISQGALPETVLVDGCDFEGGWIDLDEISEVPHGEIDLTAQNSFFDGAAAYGLNGSVPQVGSNPSANVTFVNNTLVGVKVGIDGFTFEGSIKNVNNIYYKNALAIDDTQLSVADNGHNALYGNTTNYAGGAVKGPGYVTSDPQLDTELPPRPTASSPLVGAAEKTYLPATDYWGRPRTSADIGAVQH